MAFDSPSGADASTAALGSSGGRGAAGARGVTGAGGSTSSSGGGKYRVMGSVSKESPMTRARELSQGRVSMKMSTACASSTQSNATERRPIIGKF
jgi:hypothetical protein